MYTGERYHLGVVGEDGQMAEKKYELKGYGLCCQIEEMNEDNQRFDHLGYVKQVFLGDIPYLSEEEEPVLLSNRGRGICSEYGPSSPLGFAEAKVGEWFLKMGCGVLRRTEEDYSFCKEYDFVPLEVTSERRGDAVLFQAEQKETGGYAYRYEKIFRLGENGLILQYFFTNTGEKNILWQSYSHNFFRANLCRPETVRLQFDYGENLKLRHVSGENVLKETGDEKGKESLMVAKRVADSSFYVGEFPKDRAPVGYKLWFSQPKRGIGESIDLMPIKCKLWMAENCICPELFVEGNIKPGERLGFCRTYSFF